MIEKIEVAGKKVKYGGPIDHECLQDTKNQPLTNTSWSAGKAPAMFDGISSNIP